jgi:actin-related protein
MSDTSEQSPAGEVQPPAEEKTDAMRVQLLEAKNQELKAEKQAVKKQMDDLQRQFQELQQGQQKQKQENLVKNQEFEQLWKDASQSNSTLQDQLAQKDQAIEEMRAQFQQEQIRASATNAFAQAGVHAPEDLFRLEQDKLRLKDGAIVALVGGVETPLQQHLDSLKSPGSGRDYFFSGSGARGMSAVGSASSSSGGKSWESLSFAEKIAIEQSDLENGTNNASRLKAAG